MMRGSAGGALSVSDDFERADSPSLGNDWTDLLNSFEIVSGQARGVSSTNYNLARWSADCATDDQAAEIVVGFLWSTNWVGPAVRCAESAATCYSLVRRSSSTVRFAKLTNGTASYLGADIPTTIQVGTRIGITVEGTTLTGFVDGAQVAQLTDSSISAGLGVGLLTSYNSIRAESWSGGDL